MGRALASTNLDLDCKSAEIIEGGTLDVKVKGHWDGNLHVWWYTSDGTAIAGSDYPELVGVKQGSRKSGDTMIRTIETLDSLYPELNETFNLRFSRQDNQSDDTSCLLTIKDDDKGGPGDGHIIIAGGRAALPGRGSNRVRSAYEHRCLYRSYIAAENQHGL